VPGQPCTRAVKCCELSGDITGMGDLQVLRWRKYGKDRLYVNDEAGQRIGWVDLLTGQVTIEQPDKPMPSMRLSPLITAHRFHRLGLVRSRRGWTSPTTGRVRGSGSWPRPSSPR
jgi:hypothetical protein